jgi:hypothetical protein
VARARLLKPGFFTNELLAELPFEGRLLFAGLWTLADREGRLEDRPKRIKAALFSWDAVDVQTLLVALESRGFIDRYTVNGIPLIQIAKFNEHQKPHKREPASPLPSPAFSGTGPAVTGNGSSSVTGNGSVSAESLSRSTPPFLEFPVVGQQGVTWQLSEAQVAEWATLFPNLSIPVEMRKALAWVRANPGRRKTGRGMAKFLVGWLTRATDGRHGIERRLEDRGSSTRQLPDTDRDCVHAPPCANPGNWQCQQRTTLEAARRAKAS